MSLKEYAIDTFELAQWNVLRAIMRLKPADFDVRITPKHNPIRWIIGHLTWHMDYVFNYLCQGQSGLSQEVVTYFETGSELVKDQPFPITIRQSIDLFLKISESSFAYLNILPENKFYELPEHNDGRNTETVSELLQRISLHFLGHTGQIYWVKRDLGKGGYFVTGVKKEQRQDSRVKWMKWWNDTKSDYE